MSIVDDPAIELDHDGTQAAAGDAAAGDAAAGAPEELLVEEISIDGMCGVY